MHEARRQGRNTVAVYSPEVQPRMREHLAMQLALGQAIERGELSLAFQPIVQLESMRCHLVEALLRWQHPQFGQVSPGRFIPIAEESGLIVDIGEWVLREACRQLQRWRDAGAADVSVSVNVSYRQLTTHGFVEQVGQVLADCRLPGEALLIEVTESLCMLNREQVEAVLVALRELGVRIALDDFGTGYSSLSELLALPVDYLKIDRGFLGDSSDGHRAVILTVLGLARVMGRKVVAEGVEDESTATFLADAGCHFAQGYHFARPVPASEIDFACDYRYLFHPDSDIRRLLRAS
jgi:EAL domain-containing protein (putative c-di-GMP-specific phosphodiesterase class I)